MIFHTNFVLVCTYTFVKVFKRFSFLTVEFETKFETLYEWIQTFN